MPDFAEPLARLIQEFKRLPGVGQKSAQRLAFHVLRAPRENAEQLAQAVLDVKDKLDSAGTVLATGANSLVQLEKAVTNELNATLKATLGGTLEFDDTLTNSGQLIAEANSVIDYKGGSIVNKNSSGGIEAVSSTHLTLPTSYSV